jgi:hypothetical protein
VLVRCKQLAHDRHKPRNPERDCVVVRNSAVHDLHAHPRSAQAALRCIFRVREQAREAPAELGARDCWQRAVLTHCLVHAVCLPVPKSGQRLNVSPVFGNKALHVSFAVKEAPSVGTSSTWADASESRENTNRIRASIYAKAFSWLRAVLSTGLAGQEHRQAKRACIDVASLSVPARAREVKWSEEDTLLANSGPGRPQQRKTIMNA